MKILITQDTDWIKRYPGQQHHLAERLALRGHEIRVIDYEILWKTDGKRELFSKRQIFDNISKVLNSPGITVIRPGIIKISYLDYVSMIFSYGYEINNQIKEFKPDIIIGHSILTNYISMVLAKIYNIPFVFHMTDAQHTIIPSKYLQPLGRLIEQNILKNADRVVVINDRLKDYAIRMGSTFDKTHVVKAGIDLERYDPKINGDKIREEFGIMKEDMVLFFMGWLYNFSGLKEVAIELGKIKKERSDIKLLIVGHGDAFNDIKKIIKDFDLQDHVFLAGGQPYDRIPEFIASSDICLLPAYNNETMKDIVPIKLYEYMALGKPVISTNLPGVIREFGEDNGIIYVIEPELALDKAICLIDNKMIRENGLRARKFIESYSWENVVISFENMLKYLELDMSIKCRRSFSKVKSNEY